MIVESANIVLFKYVQYYDIFVYIYYLQLAREYPKTLLRPSNVFTLDNPDILVLNDCGLWGIFIPTKAELEDVALLIRRATASRLAYSAQMKTVLVAVADINPIFREAINSTFAKYCMPDDNICDVIGEAVDNDRYAKISSDMRQRFAIRLYDIEEYSSKSSEGQALLPPIEGKEQGKFFS